MRSPGLLWEVLFFLLCHGFPLGASRRSIKCAPCTEESFALCPPEPGDCPELAYGPGCSCCRICALRAGEACGVYTARCGQGLYCHVPLQGPNALQILFRGQGTCHVDDRTEMSVPEVSEDVTSPYYWLRVRGDQDESLPLDAVKTHPRKRSETRSRKGLKPCKQELFTSVNKIAVDTQRTEGGLNRIYLPNCNKNGFYKSKQCETSLDGTPAECWCVDPYGWMMPGSTMVFGDPGCEQYLNMEE
ncbi:insulin-like growth factor-binding protein 1 [Paroedura picta]|uniref:insulin-like growth factor-binding protein 1 n=1 Tax=Paroedura picta TaxID=143630 RepID=UPI00405678F8